MLCHLFDFLFMKCKKAFVLYCICILLPVFKYKKAKPVGYVLIFSCIFIDIVIKIMIKKLILIILYVGSFLQCNFDKDYNVFSPPW